jgi:predicted aspartyl protease
VKVAKREWGASILADGSRTTFNVYDGSIEWDGQVITVPVDEVDADPLVGMRTTKSFRILVDDIDGGIVQLERI